MTTEDEVAGWHHWLDGRESEWTLGVGDGQGGLACCDSWGCKESDTTERLNWTELNWWFVWELMSVIFPGEREWTINGSFFIVVMLLSLKIKSLYHLLDLVRSVNMLPCLGHNYSFSLSSVQGFPWFRCLEIVHHILVHLSLPLVVMSV